MAKGKLYEIVWPRSNPMPRRRGGYRYEPGVPRVVEEVPELIALDLETDPDAWIVREVKDESAKRKGPAPKKGAKEAPEPPPDPPISE